MSRASVIVPTFDHASTLGFAVRSALAQTLDDLEVIIVGDGVTDEVRSVARTLAAEDHRVRFLDLPKGPHHGEVHRHTAIEQSGGEIIVYLCDDDLLLRDHVADLSQLLTDHDFAQSLNGHIDTEGVVQLYPGDLADPDYVARMCDLSKDFNFVSVTGTAHTRAFYDRAGAHWETTPSGVWPDRYQWRRMLMWGEGRAVTSSRMTAISLPSYLEGRATWSPAQRAEELGRWAHLIQGAEAQQEIDRRVARSAIDQLVSITKYALEAQDRIADWERGA